MLIETPSSTNVGMENIVVNECKSGIGTHLTLKALGVGIVHLDHHLLGYGFSSPTDYHRKLTWKMEN